MKKISLLILTIIALWSCQKDTSKERTSYQEEPRFFIKGDISGLPIDIKVSEDHYYLETSYWLEDTAVSMKGAILNDSSNTSGTFEIILRSDKKLHKAGAFNIHENLTTGLKALKDASLIRNVPGIYTLQCTPDNNNSSLSVLWEYGDGSSGSNYIARKEVHIDEHPILKTKLTTQFPGGCTSEVTHFINIKDDCDATFNVTNVVGTSTYLQVISRNGDINNVDWYMDGNFISSGREVDFSIDNTEPKIVKAEVSFVSGCTKIIEQRIAGNTTQVCENDFAWIKAEKEVYDPLQLGTVELVYYDASGKRFSSHFTNTEGKFRITSINPFQHNHNGDPTMRFFFEANVLLKSADGDQLRANNLFGSFAVAHP